MITSVFAKLDFLGAAFGKRLKSSHAKNDNAFVGFQELPTASFVFSNVAVAKKSSAKITPIASVFLAMIFAAPLQIACAQNNARALPTGGNVVAGNATITQSNLQMNINQTSQRAIVNWDSFNVGKDATVTFNQPNASAVILNRVTGASASVIDGAVRANGQVILVNPNGVTFGKGSQIDAAGVVASTLNISNKDFMDGKSTYTGGSTGAVVNQGKITTNSKDGYIALLAPEVRNEGYLIANKGPGNTVAMVSGEKITLDFRGDQLISVKVDQATYKGLIENKRLVEVPGGQIIVAAGSAGRLMAATINNTGVISASSVVDRGGMVDFVAANINQAGKVVASGKGANSDGGTITMVGENINLASGSKTVATGTANGGTINIGTSGVTYTQNANGTRSNVIAKDLATTTTVAENALVNASSTSLGNGGQINIWSSVKTSVAGSLKALGGVLGGNGGFIETSSTAQLIIAPTASIDTSAPKGKVGQWLLDPIDLTIDAAVARVISLALSLNNVTIEVSANTNACPSIGACTQNGTGSLTIASGADILKQGNAFTSLTLSASGMFTLNANIIGQNLNVIINSSIAYLNVGSTIEATQVTVRAQTVYANGTINTYGSTSLGGAIQLLAQALYVSGRLNTGTSTGSTSNTTSTTVTYNGTVLRQEDLPTFLAIQSNLNATSNALDVVYSATSANDASYVPLRNTSTNVITLNAAREMVLYSTAEIKANGTTGFANGAAGAIYLTAPSLTAESGSLIQANGNNGPGGTIAANGSDIHLAGTIQVNGSNGSNGGAGGSFAVRANTLTIDNAAVVQTNGQSGPGGTITLTSNQDIQVNQALISANGDTDGGSITIVSYAGNLNIQNALIQTNGSTGRGGSIGIAAFNQTILANTTVEATGLNQGGKILIGNDAKNGTLPFSIYTSIDARTSLSTQALSAAGVGGFIETSAHTLNLLGTINAGRGGMWLIDPIDYYVSSNVSTINSQLNAGTNVTITTAGSGGSGDIYIDANIDSSGSGNLVLNADRNIHLRANVRAASIVMSAPGTLYTGSSASSVTATTGAITISVNGFSWGAGGNPTFSSSGVLTLESYAAYFTISTTVYLQWFNFNSIGGLVLGKAGNTNTFYLDSNKTVAGSITIHGGEINLSHNLTATGAGSTISFNLAPWGGSYVYTLKTITNLYPALTAPGGIAITADYFDWSAGNPTLSTSGVVTIQPASTSFGRNVNSTWFTLAGSPSGFTLGKAGNTALLDIGAVTVSGPINIYGGTVNLFNNLSSSGGNGNINIVASTVIDPVAAISLTSGSGNITLTAPYIDRSTVANTITIASTGQFSYKPFGTSFSDISGPLTLTGAVSSNTFTGSGEISWLRINNVSGLGGLTIGKDGNTSDIESNVGWSIGGPINFIGGSIYLNNNASLATSTEGSGILLKALYEIVIGDGSTQSIRTNNGNITLWADSDGDGQGTIRVRENISFNSANGSTSQIIGGGAITLAGGNATDSVTGLPNGYAFAESSRTSIWGNTSFGGVQLGAYTYSYGGGYPNSIAFYSGGGNVVIKGKSANGMPGITWLGGASGGSQIIDAGAGTITLDGQAVGTGHGIELNYGGGPTSPELRSSSSATTAISVTGITTSTTGYSGYQGTATMKATGTGGITISGTSAGAGSSINATGLYLYAASGAIAINGAGGTGAIIGGTWGRGTLAGSSSNITVTAATINLYATTTNTSGNIKFDGSLTLRDNIAIASSAGIVTFTGAINSDSATTPRALTVSAGTGSIIFGGAIGGINPISNLTASGSAGITINGNITTATGFDDGLLFEKFDGYVGSNLTSFTTAQNVQASELAGAPGNTSSVTSTTVDICASSGCDDTYSYRVTGYFVPKASGIYTFQISGDDSYWLFMGNANQTIGQLKNQVQQSTVSSGMAGYIAGWNGSSCCTNVSGNTASLVAGTAYPIYAMMSENTGGDNLRLAFKLSTDSTWVSANSNTASNGIGYYFNGAPNAGVVLTGPVTINNNASITAPKGNLQIAGAVTANQINLSAKNVMFSGAGGVSTTGNVSVNVTGDIVLNSALTYTGVSAGTFAFTAGDSIFVNNTITSIAGPLALQFTAGASSGYIGIENSLTTRGGAISFTGATTALQQNALTINTSLTGSTGGSVTFNGNVLLAKDSGDITINTLIRPLLIYVNPIYLTILCHRQTDGRKVGRHRARATPPVHGVICLACLVRAVPPIE